MGYKMTRDIRVLRARAAREQKLRDLHRNIKALGDVIAGIESLTQSERKNWTDVHSKAIFARSALHNERLDLERTQ